MGNKKQNEFQWNGIAYTKQYTTAKGEIEFIVEAEQSTSDAELLSLESIGVGILSRWSADFSNKVGTRCKKYLRKGANVGITNDMWHLGYIIVDVKGEKDRDRFLLGAYLKNGDENLLEADYLEVQILRKNERVLIEPVYAE